MVNAEWELHGEKNENSATNGSRKEQTGKVKHDKHKKHGYEPFKDRSNVAFYKPSISNVWQQSGEACRAGSGNGTGNGNADVNVNKRQFSPSGAIDSANKVTIESCEEGDESEDVGGEETESEWTIATGVRKKIGKRNGKSNPSRQMVTPIVIRHRPSAVGAQQPAHHSYIFDNDDNMETDDGGVNETENETAIPQQREQQQQQQQHQHRGEAVVDASPMKLVDGSVFYTSKPEGGLRDVLTVECLEMNGDVFRGTITYTEATIKIFQQEIGLPIDLIHSVKMAFNKYRTVSFKLKKQINIDELAEKLLLLGLAFLYIQFTFY